MIETVLGPIRPEQMKACLTHEHLSVYGASEASIAIREKMLRTIVPRLRELRTKYKCNTMVECTPSVSTGRDLVTYAEIARQAKFHVVATTGFYTVPRSPWWMLDASVGELVRRWQAEARDGMDGTGIRPGVLKATSGRELADRRRRRHALVTRWIEALARTHHKTGLPITTHVSGHFLAAQLAALVKFGVPPSAVMLGHADWCAQLDQLLAAADQGAYFSFNGAGDLSIAKPTDVRRAMGFVKALVDRGHGDQVTLSVDATFWPRDAERLDPDMACPEGQRPKRTYRCVFTRMVPTLAKLGVTQKQIRRMLIDNPRRHLTGS